MWDHAIKAAANAVAEVRELPQTDPDPAGDTAAATAEILTAAGRLIEGDRDGPLTTAARDCDQAARERYARLPESTPTGVALRMAALHLARTGRRGPHKSEAARPRRRQRALILIQADPEHGTPPSRKGATPQLRRSF